MAGEFQIAEGFVEIEAKADKNQIRGEARRATKEFADGADNEARRRRGGFFRQLFTPDRSLLMALRTGIPNVLGSPIGAAALSLGALFAASFLGAFVASGVLTAIGAGFVGLGAFILRENEKIKSSFSTLAATASAGLERAAQSLVPHFVDALNRVNDLFPSMIEDPLRRIFSGIGPIITPLADSIVQTINNILSALASPDVLAGIRSFFEDFSHELPRIGSAIGEFFSKIAGNSEMVGLAFGQVISVIENLLNFTADTINVLTTMFVGFGRLWRPIGQAISPVIDLIGTILGFVVQLHPAVIILGTALVTAAVAMQRFGTAARTASFLMGPWGLVIGVVTTALAAFSAGIDEAGSASDQAAKSLEGVELAFLRLEQGRITGVIEEVSRLHGELEKAKDRDTWDNIKDGVSAFTFSLDGLPPSLREVRDKHDELIKAMEPVDQFFTSLVRQGNIEQTRAQMKSLQEQLGMSDEEFKKFANEALPNTLIQLDLFEEANSDAAKAAEEANKAIREAWTKGLEGFADTVGQYQDVLKTEEEKEQERAQAVADATEDASDSWEDHAKDVKVSIGDLIEEQDKQIEAMRNWATNIATLAALGMDEGLLNELREAGPESAGLVQELVDAPKKKREEYIENWRELSASGTSALTQKLEEAGPALEEIAKSHGKKTARKIADGMVANDQTIFEAAREQGLLVVRTFNGEIKAVDDVKLALDRVGLNQSAAFASRQLNNVANPGGRARKARVDAKKGGGFSFVEAWMDHISRSRKGFVNAKKGGGFSFVEDWMDFISRSRKGFVNARQGSGGSFIERWLNSLARSRTATINVRPGDPGYGVYKAAGGLIGGGVMRGMQTGGVAGGMNTLVGENGPEIAELPFGTRVIPSGQSQAEMSRAPIPGINTASQIELLINSSGSRLDDLLLEILRSSIRVRGGNVQTVLGRV